jgi:hypothetical protein
VAFFGQDRDEDGPAAHYALCDVQDGNYILLDVGHPENGRYPLIDGDHEAWPDPEYCKQITSSFSEFLEKALRSQGRMSEQVEAELAAAGLLLPAPSTAPQAPCGHPTGNVLWEPPVY